MRVAIVSTDGKTVNEHFGRADRFLIYDLTPEGVKFLEERGSEPFSVGDPKHPFDREHFEEVAYAIGDCERVYATKIGVRPAEELEKKGIKPVLYKGPIAHIPN